MSVPRASRLLERTEFLHIERSLSPRTDLVWLAGNTVGLGLTLLAAFVVPAHGYFFVYLAVLARVALYARFMIGPWCAAFVPLGEAIMFLGILPVFAACASARDPKRAGPIVWGVAFAAIIFVSYLVAYLLLEVVL